MDRDILPLHSAVGFHRSIQDSKNINVNFRQIADWHNLRCSLDHVDGSMNPKERLERLS